MFCAHVDKEQPVHWYSELRLWGMAAMPSYLLLAISLASKISSGDLKNSVIFFFKYKLKPQILSSNKIHCIAEYPLKIFWRCSLLSGRAKDWTHNCPMLSKHCHTDLYIQFKSIILISMWDTWLILILKKFIRLFRIWEFKLQRRGKKAGKSWWSVFSHQTNQLLKLSHWRDVNKSLVSWLQYPITLYNTLPSWMKHGLILTYITDYKRNTK